MKNLSLPFLAIASLLLSGCYPNTGHSLATTDTLETDDSKDFVITWVLEAPEASRPIENRIKDAKLNYSIDLGDWQSTPLEISRITNSKIQILGRIDQAEIVEHSQIRCFPEYVFDGTREGKSKRQDPRTIKIYQANAKDPG